MQTSEHVYFIIDSIFHVHITGAFSSSIHKMKCVKFMRTLLPSHMFLHLFHVSYVKYFYFFYQSATAANEYHLHHDSIAVWYQIRDKKKLWMWCKYGLNCIQMSVSMVLYALQSSDLHEISDKSIWYLAQKSIDNRKIIHLSYLNNAW